MTRPKGTRKYFSQQLTAKEKREIVAETRKGTKQIEIARRFACCVDTIRTVQRAAGFGRWRELTTDVERECVALLRLGHGQYRVSKITRVPEPKIRKLMVKYRIHHPVGDQGLPAAKRAQITARVRAREAYGIRIAEKEKVSPAPVLAIAHAIFGPGRFRSSGVPLTSLVNSDAHTEANYRKFLETVFLRTFSVEAQAMEFSSIFTALVERYAEIWYHGTIPADRLSFVEELTSVYMPENPRVDSPFTQEEWRKERELVAAHLRTAVECVAGTEARWTN